LNPCEIDLNYTLLIIEFQLIYLNYGHKLRYLKRNFVRRTRKANMM